jgi:diadenosine tetraphosphatase ApaH/serine/threonine PP2A family protein phosphatase
VRFLILSDLHANLEALQAVLDDAAGAWDAVLCLGDIVGYGADPNAVADWIRSHAQHTVRGNHDKVAVGLETLEWFNPIAQGAARWTQETLTTENRQWLRELPKGPLPLDGFQLVHGSPLDEDQYLIEPEDVALAAGVVELPLTFFGHTHIQGGFELRPRRLLEVKRPSPFEAERTHDLAPGSRYLINVGSVGQPRDRDPRAAYALYDSGDARVQLRRVKYDIARAQKKIINAGLPTLLAERLADGR